MPTYPAYTPDWNVETTHPIEETEEGPICASCLSMVQPAIDTATDWDSVAFGSQMEDAQGTTHVVSVRRIV